MSAKVLSQNVDENLTYFVCFLLSVHLWMTIELHLTTTIFFLQL